MDALAVTSSTASVHSLSIISSLLLSPVVEADNTETTMNDDQQEEEPLGATAVFVSSAIVNFDSRAKSTTTRFLLTQRGEDEHPHQNTTDEGGGDNDKTVQYTDSHPPQHSSSRPGTSSSFSPAAAEPAHPGQTQQMMHKELTAPPTPTKPATAEASFEKADEAPVAAPKKDEASAATTTSTATPTGLTTDSGDPAASAPFGGSEQREFSSEESEEDRQPQQQDHGGESRQQQSTSSPADEASCDGHQEARDTPAPGQTITLPLFSTTWADSVVGAPVEAGPVHEESTSASQGIAAKKKRPRASGGERKNNKKSRSTGDRFVNGRWTEAEHQAFLAGLAAYGREWKRVAMHIPTRTSAQVRSHAQKYFCKLQQQQQQQQAAEAEAAATAAAVRLQQQHRQQYRSEERPQSSLRTNVERILAEPATVQSEIDETLQRLRERYRELQRRLRETERSTGESWDRSLSTASPSSLQDSELIALHVLQGGLPSSGNDSHCSRSGSHGHANDYYDNDSPQPPPQARDSSCANSAGTREDVSLSRSDEPQQDQD